MLEKEHRTLNHSAFEREHLFSHLATLGNCVELGMSVSPFQVAAELEKFRDQWTPFDSPTQPGQGSFMNLTSAVFDAVPEVHSIVRPLISHLAQSYFLKLDLGGFIPYQRISMEFGPKEALILVPLNDHSPRDFIFLVGQDRVIVENGKPYLINGRAGYAMFSFADPSLHLMLHIDLNFQSAEVIKGMLPFPN